MCVWLFFFPEIDFCQRWNEDLLHLTFSQKSTTSPYTVYLLVHGTHSPSFCRDARRVFAHLTFVDGVFEPPFWPWQGDSVGVQRHSRSQRTRSVTHGRFDYGFLLKAAAGGRGKGLAGSGQVSTRPAVRLPHLGLCAEAAPSPDSLTALSAWPLPARGAAFVAGSVPFMFTERVCSDTGSADMWISNTIPPQGVRSKSVLKEAALWVREALFVSAQDIGKHNFFLSYALVTQHHGPRPVWSQRFSKRICGPSVLESRVGMERLKMQIFRSRPKQLSLCTGAGDLHPMNFPRWLFCPRKCDNNTK